jgi:ABC-type polysaccharide/polyol phosphate transport system ATPase subunit
MASVTLDNVSVEFNIYNGRSRALKSEILRRAVGGRIKHGPHDSITAVEALKDISFKASPGERIGIVGHNGAGKSTLLRVLGRIYPPTSGRADIRGSISSLVDLTMGMELEESGFQNIMIKGTLLGLRDADIRALVPEIAEFSELGEFLHLPVRAYSSGMLLRLGFAISTAIRPDIAVFDEVMGVGDLSFHAKAKARLLRLVEQASIVFICSHDMTVIRENCSRALWLEGGRLLDDGPADDIVKAYLSKMNPSVE